MPEGSLKCRKADISRLIDEFLDDEGGSDGATTTAKAEAEGEDEAEEEEEVEVEVEEKAPKKKKTRATKEEYAPVEPKVSTCQRGLEFGVRVRVRVRVMG